MRSSVVYTNDELVRFGKHFSAIATQPEAKLAASAATLVGQGVPINGGKQTDSKTKGLRIRLSIWLRADTGSD